jgi:Flp pilus assembly protein CpaB
MTRRLRLVSVFGILAVLAGACWATSAHRPAPPQTFACDAQPTTASADDVTLGHRVRDGGVKTTRRVSVAQSAYPHDDAILQLAAPRLAAASTTEARRSIPLYQRLRVYRL